MRFSFRSPARKEQIRAWCFIILGCVIGAAAYPLFLIPNNIAPGGLSGVAMILNYLFAWPVGVTSIFLNLPLFLIGYRTMGRTFVFRTLIATLLFSALIDLIQLPPLTDDPLLGAVYGAILLGVGIGFIMKGEATTGGTDMIASMVNHRIPFISVGVFLFLVDCMVTLAAAFTMGARMALYALICIFINAKIVDLVLAGFGSSKACHVITTRGVAISQRIMAELDRGATLLQAKGAYSGEEKTLLISIVANREVAHVKRIVREEDTAAFMYITDTHETLGEGFSALEDKR